MSLHGDKDSPISVYPGAVAQILTNLLTNSYLHAFDNGALPGKIDITITALDGATRLRFEDNGNGIPEEKLEESIRPVFTTKRAKGGTGWACISFIILSFKSLKLK